MLRSLFLVLLMVWFFPVQAQFFADLASQGSGGAFAGSESAGGSQGGGVYGTYGASGAVAGSTAYAGAQLTGGGLTLDSGGLSGVLSGSTVGGVSAGNAAGGSAAGAQGAASYSHAATGFVLGAP